MRFHEEFTMFAQREIVSTTCIASQNCIFQLSSHFSCELNAMSRRAKWIYPPLKYFWPRLLALA